MAREEDLTGRYLEEMPACLRDLFEQTSCEEEKCFANNAFTSAKSYTTILGINGMQLPPPLLTEEERAEMREYRRQAVRCETKLFDRRREKYSDLILQVMSVMDRIQGQREAKLLTEMNDDTESILERTAVINEIADMAGTNRTLQQNHSQPVTHELHPFALDVSSYGRSSENKTDRSRRVLSQMGYMPESMLMSSGESGLLEHQFVRKADSREKIQTVPLGFDRMDIPLSSTMDNEISKIKRPFSQLSVAADEMFSDIPLDSTLRNKLTSFQPERNGPEYDSLASTSLSLAFSDSSNSTVRSVVELQPHSLAKQEINRKSGTVQDYVSHKQQPTTTQSKNPKKLIKPLSSKQKGGKQISETSGSSQRPTLSDQDETLINLEKLRQKLLEEKQKHMDALKQQELQRLRKQQREHSLELDQNYSTFQSSTPTRASGRPRSTSLPSTRTSDLKESLDSNCLHVIDRSSPLRRPLSMPPGEMYSILELSGENLDLDAQDHHTEPESSSDKENHVVHIESSVARLRETLISERPARNVQTVMNDKENIHTGFSKRNYSHKSSAASKGNLKFFERNGRDKFAKLSAYAKGFLTRCLMKTAKVQGFIQTIKDTKDVLADISKDDAQSMQEKMLKQNVEGHLKIARCSLHDVFFSIPVKERMSYIAQSRSLARVKQAKRTTRSSVGQSKLSAVTLRAIQRRQEGFNHESSVQQTEHTEVKLKHDPREERKRKNWNIRVLKPQQGHTSPPLPDKTRSKKQVNRPTTAPERPLNARMQKEDSVSKRPQTADPVRGISERPARSSLAGGITNQPAKRPGRKSLGGIIQQPKMAGALGNTKPRAQKRLSLPASAQPRIRTTNDVAQRPQTASEVKTRSRTLAANFVK